MVDWERRVEAARVVVPARPIRAFATETASDLGRSLVRIEGWTGSAFPGDSRFHQALAVLERVASFGQFVVDDTVGESTMRAIQLALDTLAIADALPDQRVADLRKDLQAAGVGSLLGEGATQALQAQSQLIVRAAFYRAGVKPSQPTHSGAGGRKKPDILIENGTANHPVEVKRPTAAKNVIPRALDAAEQIRFSTSKGGMVIDVTDCLVDATPEAADDAVVAHAEAIGSQFFVQGSGWKPGYSHVIMVGVMARPAWHVDLTGDNEGQVLIHNTSCVAAFGTARGTLDTLQAHWLRKHLEAGLNRLGFTSDETNAHHRPNER